MLICEKKMVLTRAEYTALLNCPFLERKGEIHNDAYYDTDSLSMNKNNITCRIREMSGRLTATVKSCGDSSASVLERTFAVDSMPVFFPYDGLLLTYKGVLSTVRHSGQPVPAVQVTLDKSTYLGVTDYELKIEYPVALEYAAETVLDTLSAKLFRQGLLLNRAAFMERVGTASSKSRRFFERLLQKKGAAVCIAF